MATASKRRWFRFSLRTMLTLVIVVAIPVAWIAKERRQSQYEHQIAEQLLKQGFEIVRFGGPFDSWNLDDPNLPQVWWRNLARIVLGDRVVEVGGPPREFDDLKPLVGLGNLRIIQLHNTLIRDIAPLASLKNLREISLTFTQVSDLTPLANLRNLQSLALTGVPATNFAPLAGLRNLRFLLVGSTKFSDVTPLGSLMNLRHLDLSGTHVNDLSLLAGMPNLKALVVDGNSVSTTQLKDLKKALPNCEFTICGFRQ